MKNTTIITNIKDLNRRIEMIMNHHNLERFEVRFTKGIYNEDVIAIDYYIKEED